MFPFCLWSAAHYPCFGQCVQQRLCRYRFLLPQSMKAVAEPPTNFLLVPQWVSSCVQTTFHELTSQFLSPSQQHKTGDFGPELEPPEEEGDSRTERRSQGRNIPVLWYPSLWLLPGAGSNTAWKLTSLSSEQDSVALGSLILQTVVVSARRSRSGDFCGWRDPGKIAEIQDSLGLPGRDLMDAPVLTRQEKVEWYRRCACSS